MKRTTQMRTGNIAGSATKKRKKKQQTTRGVSAPNAQALDSTSKARKTRAFT